VGQVDSNAKSALWKTILSVLKKCTDQDNFTVYENMQTCTIVPATYSAKVGQISSFFSAKPELSTNSADLVKDFVNVNTIKAIPYTSCRD